MSDKWTWLLLSSKHVAGRWELWVVGEFAVSRQVLLCEVLFSILRTPSFRGTEPPSLCLRNPGVGGTWIVWKGVGNDWDWGTAELLLVSVYY